MDAIRKLLLAGLAGAAIGAAVPALAQNVSPVTDSSYVLPNGERVLELSVVVPAGIEAVWDAFATTEGWTSWAAPVGRVEARVGGVIESSYDPGAVIGAPGNIRNEIVALAPRRLLVIRNVQAPPNAPFDVPTYQRLQTALWFERVDAVNTRVTLLNAGYRDGAADDGVYRHFLAGNRWTFEQLRRRFVSGPVDWAKMLAPPKREAKPAAETAPK
jgi:uncharacterized protein YndB with AHSA1/START domain